MRTTQRLRVATLRDADRSAGPPYFCPGFFLISANWAGCGAALLCKGFFFGAANCAAGPNALLNCFLCAVMRGLPANAPPASEDPPLRGAADCAAGCVACCAPIACVVFFISFSFSNACSEIAARCNYRYTYMSERQRCGWSRSAASALGAG